MKAKQVRMQVKNNAGLARELERAVKLMEKGELSPDLIVGWCAASLEAMLSLLQRSMAHEGPASRPTWLR